MRRGIKEMDLILIRYADARLAELGAQDLDLYEALLSENDQDLLQWVTGQVAVPPMYTDLIAQIAAVVEANAPARPTV